MTPGRADWSLTANNSCATRVVANQPKCSHISKHIWEAALAFYRGINSRSSYLDDPKGLALHNDISKSFVLQLEVSLVADHYTLLPVEISGFHLSAHHYKLIGLTHASNHTLRTIFLKYIHAVSVDRVHHKLSSYQKSRLFRSVGQPYKYRFWEVYLNF